VALKVLDLVDDVLNLKGEDGVRLCAPSSAVISAIVTLDPVCSR